MCYSDQETKSRTRWLHKRILPNVYENVNSYPSQMIFKNCRGRNTPNPLYEASITLISKSEKITHKKKSIGQYHWWTYMQTSSTKYWQTMLGFHSVPPRQCLCATPLPCLAGPSSYRGQEMGGQGVDRLKGRWPGGECLFPHHLNPSVLLWWKMPNPGIELRSPALYVDS